MGKKRKNGEGSWGTKTINGIKYKYFRNSKGKYFYGKTEKEVKQKIEKAAKSSVSNKTPFGEYLVWYHNEIHRKTVEETTYASYINVCKAINDNKYYNISDIQMGSFSIKNNYFSDFFEAVTPYYSYNSLRSMRRVIRAAVIYAEKHEDIEKGIFEESYFPKEAKAGVKRRKINFLPKEIADKMYKHIDDTYNTGNPKYGLYYWVVLLIMHTGMRTEEVRALMLKDIDFDRRTLTINKAYARLNINGNGEKTNYVLKDPKSLTSNRVIPLNSIAIEMLHRIINLVRPKKKTDYILYNNLYRLSNSVISNATKRLLRDIHSPIKECSPHALRHTFGSILYEQGVGLKTISELLGHSSIKITADIYISLTQKHLHNSVSVLEPDYNEANYYGDDGVIEDHELE